MSYNLHPIESGKEIDRIRAFLDGIDGRVDRRQNCTFHIVPTEGNMYARLYPGHADLGWRIDHQSPLAGNYIFQIQLQKNIQRVQGESTTYILIFVSRTWIEKTDRSITCRNGDDRCGAVVKHALQRALMEAAPNNTVTPPIPPTPAYRYIDYQGRLLRPGQMDEEQYKRREKEAWTQWQSR